MRDKTKLKVNDERSNIKKKKEETDFGRQFTVETLRSPIK